MKVIVRLFIIFQVFIFLGARGQVQIKGFIFDSLNTVPVAYAKVHFSNSFKGSFSNLSGYFEFNYETDPMLDSIVVERIGYESLKLSLKSLADKDTLLLYLDPSPVLLDEVIIVGENDSIRAIVEMALAHLKFNYPTQQHFYSGFFRFVRLENKQFVRLIEAAVDIQDFGFHGLVNNPKTKIQVMQLRKSDFLGSKSIIEKAYARMFNKNQLYDTYERNWLSQYPAKDAPAQYIFNESFTKQHKFKLRGETSLDDEDVFIIDYFPASLSSLPEEYVLLAASYGTLLINSADWAIIALEESVGTRQKVNQDFANKNYFDGQNMSTYRVQFSKFNNKYYLKSIDYTRWKGAGSFELASLYINDLIDDKRDFKKIRQRFLLSRTLDINDTEFAYDSIFWLSYNMVHEKLLDGKVIDDLQNESTLAEQFSENGLRKRKEKQKQN